MRKKTKIILIRNLINREIHRLNKKYKTDKLSLAITISDAGGFNLVPSSIIYDGVEIGFIAHSLSLKSVASGSCKTLSKSALSLIYKDLVPLWENTIEYKFSQMDLI